MPAALATVLPTISLCDRFQGAFVGASLGAALAGDIDLFPQQVLESILLNYERTEYRYHRKNDDDQRQQWSTEQWLLAEILWQSLDQPLDAGSGEAWLRRVVAGWRSLAPITPSQSTVAQFLEAGETAARLTRDRAPLAQWKSWLQTLGTVSTATTGEATLLGDRDLWAILGILSRTEGDWFTAIAQSRMIVDANTANAANKGADESNVHASATPPSELLAWVGAIVGTTTGADNLSSNQKKPYSPVPDAAKPPLPSITYNAHTHNARQLGFQCFIQWSGLAATQTPLLAPWTIRLHL